MGDNSKISWTESTWNPVTGCSHVSPGCEHCYAEALSLRHGWSKHPWGAQWAAENVMLHPERLDQPLRWKRPRRIFVNSMSDLFHEQIPDWFIFAVWWTMAKTPQHAYQILTKRPARMLEWFRRLDDRGPVAIKPIGYRVVDGTPQHFGRTEEEAMAVVNSGRGRMFHDWIATWGEPPPGCAQPTYDWMEGPRWWPTVLTNVWLGVSVEDQRRADERIPLLLQVPAAVRFLSCEPLLGAMDLARYVVACPSCGRSHLGYCEDPKPLISWIIVGGESGPRYRPMNLDWARSIRDQCQASGVPFFFKQTSGPRPGIGRELDGRLWEEYPESS